MSIRDLQGDSFGDGMHIRGTGSPEPEKRIEQQINIQSTNPPFVLSKQISSREFKENMEKCKQLKQNLEEFSREEIKGSFPGFISQTTLTKIHSRTTEKKLVDAEDDVQNGKNSLGLHKEFINELSERRLHHIELLNKPDNNA